MMKSGTRRRAAILTAVMLLSGCGTTPNRGTSGSGGMLTWQQANEEYKATVEDFPFELMNGDAFPANIPKAQAASSLYAKGSGEGQAYVYWQCSVERDILDNSQTNAEAAEAPSSSCASCWIPTGSRTTTRTRMAYTRTM